MKPTHNRHATRWLAILLAMLLVASMLSLTVFAEETEADPSSISISSSVPEEEELPGEESSLVELQGDENEPTEKPEEDEEDLTEEPQAAAALGLLDLAAYPAADLAAFQLALDEILVAGEGHIILEDTIIMPDRVEIPTGVDLTISGLTGDEQILLNFTGNKRHFYVEGSLTLAGVTVSGRGVSGGILVDDGTLTLGAGGVVAECSYEEVNANVTDIWQLNGGGIVLIEGATMYLSGGEVRDNKIEYLGTNVRVGGAGIAMFDSSLYMTGGSIHGNVAGNSMVNTSRGIHGGGINMNGGTFEMTGGEIFGNTASYGGAIYAMYTDIELRGGSLHSNMGVQQGGALFLNDGSNTEIYDGFVLSDNTSYFRGGAISTSNSAVVTMYGGLITRNRVIGSGAGSTILGGGAIENAAHKPEASFTILGGEISHNHSAYNGGAIINFSHTNYNGDSLTIAGASIVNNRAAWDGGGIYTWQALTPEPNYYGYQSLTVTDTYFEGNYAGNGGHYFNYTSNATNNAILNLYNARIDVTGLSAPFDLNHTDVTLNKAYNNFDIYYTYGDALDYHTVEFFIDGSTVPWKTIPVLDTSPPGQVADPSASYVPTGNETLDGWYIHQSQVGDPDYLYDFNEDVTGDLQLYARRIAGPLLAQNDVTFYRNHFDGDTQVHYTAQDVVEGTQVPEPPTDPAATQGYVFSHWATGSAEGSVEWDFDDPMPDTPLELYAQYKKATFTVTFDMAGQRQDTGSLQYSYVLYDALVTPLAASETEIDGYTFDGWWYAAESRYWRFEQDRMPASNITLEARWTAKTTPPVTPPSSSGSSSTFTASSSSKGGGGGTNPPLDRSSSAPATSRPAASSSVPAYSMAPSSETSSSKVSSVVSEPPVVSSDADDDYDNQDIDGTDVPLNWWQRGDGWSLLNLIISILLLLSAAFQLVRAVLAKNRREDEYGNESVRNKHRLWTIPSAITGIAPIILLFIMEDFAGVMLMLDKWTPWFFGFAVLHAAFTLVAVTMKPRWKQIK